MTESPKKSSRTIEILLLWLTGKGRKWSLFGVLLTTLFFAYFALHAIAATQKKELRAWPEDREGWIDSRRYWEVLYRDYGAVQEKKLLKKLNTSRVYLYNNLGEIARDSFQIDEKEALKLMQPIPGGL